jgi:hypothetical protein
MPTLAKLDGNRVTIRGESAARFQALDDNWKVTDESLENNVGRERADLCLTTSQSASQITIGWRPGADHAEGGTVVERAWIQSWISGGIRQDRAVYRFTTSSDELSLSLPAGIAADNLELRLDRRSLQPPIKTDGTLRLSLPRSDREIHVLELRYQWEHVNNHAHWIETEGPRFADGVWVQRTYWQLVLPVDEHLVFSPTDLTPEFNWKWTGIGWGRQASWDQAELEKWSGAISDERLPEATNRYLFSTLGTPSKFVASTARRWQIVLISSATALLVGLLLLYLPSRGRPWGILAMGVIMLMLSASVPDGAMLFAQAAVLGFGLILCAAILRHRMARRHASGRVVMPGSSGSSTLERSSRIRQKSRSLEMAGAVSTSAAESLELPATGSQHG